MRVNKSNIWSEIKLGEGAAVPNRVQVLRVGVFNHPTYGKLDITKKVLSEMKSNFDKRVRGVDVGFDYFHESDKEASGWPKRLELSAAGTELWAEDVDWTPKATKMLSDRELRYFSPDFSFSWKNPETGKTIPNVLFGGGLTNRPFVKDMQPIVADEKNNIESEQDMKTIEQLEAELKVANATILKLTEDKNAETTLRLTESQKVNAQKVEVDNLKKEVTELTGKVELAEKASAAAVKESEFAVMLTEGKAVAAQKEAYIKGDMAAFVKLSQPVNLKGKGSAQTETTDVDGDDDDQIIKLAEQLEEKNKSLTRGESLSLAKKQFKANAKK